MACTTRRSLTSRAIAADKRLGGLRFLTAAGLLSAALFQVSFVTVDVAILPEALADELVGEAAIVGPAPRPAGAEVAQVVGLA